MFMSQVCSYKEFAHGFCISLFIGIPITEAGICSTKNSIFVSGGKPNGKQFYELSLSTKEWMKLPDMEHDRRSPGT